MDLDIEKALVLRVISRMDLTAKSLSQDVMSTKHYVQQALDILAPFKPNPVIETMMTNFLCEHSADEEACIKAWALFLDYRSMEEAKLQAA